MRLKLRPAAVLQASNGALRPRGVFWLVLFWGRSSRACPSGQGQQPRRERQVCGSVPGRSTMTEGPGVWLGKVKRCLGRGSEHSWKRMECLGSTQIGGGLALVGVFSEFCPPSFRLTLWRQWKASASSHPYPGGCYWVLGGRDLPNPGIEPMSPALAGVSFRTGAT